MTPATLAHATALATRMHERAILESRDLGYDPLPGLQQGLDTSSEVWCGLSDNQPLCMFGIVPDSPISNVGHIWCAISDDLPEHRKVFLRANRIFVADAMTRYRCLYGYVFARNSASIRWLSWLGFRVGDECEGFRRFEMER